MNPAAKLIMSDTMSLQLLPRWITVQRDEDPETVAFLSGAALATLDTVLRDPNGTLPCALLRDRMALDSAVACLKLEGRNEPGSDIRDAVCLARAGDRLGPAGEMFMGWRKLARINLGVSGWMGRVENALPTALAHEAVSILGSPSGTPVGQASDILAELLPRFPREEAGALMLADVALARAVGWDRPVPLLGAHMVRRDIRAIATGAGEPRLFVHRAMVAACDTAIRLAADLDLRVAKLRSVAPKLRAKGSDAALALFLSHDAVSPSCMLSPMIQGTLMPMTDRAARRLCDRLVELGVVRELTGRPRFRLYGV
ncbi:MAG: DUF1403 family protein [Sulfitobacter litoralis]|jgi:hypothetical protein|nr:DUF1403 family protein [Sulfitobacter litoralis]MCF7728646.1 DUF1403 family protein [Sulfitobacter sp. M22]MCF7779711.1 DUF1403 family protein [Sulfitobacter sp. M220]HDY95645.1 DUF1403 family protein [Sulfitobacter litoralis]|tara:strand:+ start:1190 stop:2131 length:942 start_codon:yes stop_codon:yes gene_type:complete